MIQVCEAVYKNGVFKPITPHQAVAEGQRVNVVLNEKCSEENEAAPRISVAEFKASFRELFEGLSESEIQEIDRVMLDRSHFFTEPS